MLSFNDGPDIKRIIEGFVGQEQHHEETLLTLQSTLRTPGGRVQRPGIVKVASNSVNNRENIAGANR